MGHDLIDIVSFIDIALEGDVLCIGHCKLPKAPSGRSFLLRKLRIVEAFSFTAPV